MSTADQRGLFFQAAMNIVSYCFWACRRVPESISNLVTALESALGDSHYWERVILLLLQGRIKHADIYSDYTDQRSEDFEEAAATLRPVDRRLEQALNDLTPRHYRSASIQIHGTLWCTAIELWSHVRTYRSFS